MTTFRPDLSHLVSYATMTRTVEEAAALVASGDTECAPCTLRANYEGYADEGLGRRVAALVSLVAAGDRPAASWSGPIGFENLATGDGRMIETNALSWETPVPLMWAPENNGGHQGAQVVGWITDIARGENGAIVGSGAFDLGSDIGREAFRQVKEGLTPGISMDLDDVSFEVRVKAELLGIGMEDMPMEPHEPEVDADGRVVVWESSSDDELMVTTSARIRGATLVATPAFADALVALEDADEEMPALVAAAAIVEEAERALVAPVLPPAAWFGAPDLDEPTPFTISDNGRVFGHIAAWGTCHIGYAGQCVTPPSSATNYSYFRTGEVMTEEGGFVAVGSLTIDTGHAGDKMGALPAISHYDNTGTTVAYVTVGEDKHGIWVAGTLRADATPEQVRALRAAPMSGDWRKVGAGMELVAVLGVNVPGFPIPRTRALVAGGQMQSLVAAGMLAPRQVIRPGLPGAFSTDDLRYLKHLADAERERQRREAPASPERLATAEAMAKRVRVMAFATGMAL